MRDLHLDPKEESDGKYYQLLSKNLGIIVSVLIRTAGQPKWAYILQLPDRQLRANRLSVCIYLYQQLRSMWEQLYQPFHPIMCIRRTTEQGS